MDYIISPNRWKNAITDVEADPEPNIYTDHFPLIAKVRVKLKAIAKRTSKLRIPIDPSLEQSEKFNTQFKEKVSDQDLWLDAITSTKADGKELLQAVKEAAMETLPHTTKGRQ